MTQKATRASFGQRRRGRPGIGQYGIRSSSGVVMCMTGKPRARYATRVEGVKLRRRRRLNFRRDLREPFQLVELVKHWIEHQELRAAGDHLAQPLRAPRGVAPHAHLRGEFRLAVEGAEPLRETPA